MPKIQTKVDSQILSLIETNKYNGKKIMTNSK